MEGRKEGFGTFSSHCSLRFSPCVLPGVEKGVGCRVGGE